MELSSNQKIGLGVLALVGVYFLAIKLMSDAAKPKDDKQIRIKTADCECITYPCDCGK